MKVYQVFESYPLFYQPYIPPVIKALDDVEGVKITIVAFKGEKRKGSDYKLVMIPGYRKRILYKKIYQFFNKEFRNLDYFEIRALKDKVDIIHIQHSYLFPKVINILKLDKSKRPKIIITLRGSETYVKPWIYKKWKIFFRDYGSEIDAFVVMSENQKIYLTRWGIPLSNIHVIPVSFGKKSIVHPKIMNDKEMRIVSIFRMVWEKNISDCLKFVKKLKQKNISVTYDIYGDGRDLGQVYYLRDKYDLNEEVNIFGRIPNNELKDKIINYDFILQLSHSESLGMSVIEAQSNGVLAIVSNNGGLTEIIRNGKSGIIVDLDNFDSSILEVFDVWKNPDIYSQMSQSAIEYSHENFTIEKEVERTTNLYLKMIQ
ncbi:glycosyltransferase family 4 protein [Aequorivita sinensis]|uniref:glycosyltransferase family 4 protein n=1 Tax=Aequorivita sinensis TaxID=1382458 RepID=UPI0022FFC48F|nr:glycosyltransferase family 4 protein [Aequorivita sinensis]